MRGLTSCCEVMYAVINAGLHRSHAAWLWHGQAAMWRATGQYTHMPSYVEATLAGHDACMEPPAVAKSVSVSSAVFVCNTSRFQC